MAGQSVTVNGITVCVSRDAFDDIELLEDLAEAEGGNGLLYVSIFKRVFGDEQYERVKRELANDEGRTSITAMSEFFTGVVSAVNALDAKN